MFVLYVVKGIQPGVATSTLYSIETIEFDVDITTYAILVGFLARWADYRAFNNIFLKFIKK